jgi:3-deoxy-7-phosphoheptulonate synthase
MCRASVAAGADGVHVEVHNCPEQAMSDGPQALLPHQFLDLMGDLRRLAKALDRSFWHPTEN